MKSIITGLSASVLLFALGGCGAEAPQEESVSAADSTINPQLYVLECGYMDMTNWHDFKTLYGVEKDAVETPIQVNPCFLIKHGEQSMLWDAGLPDSFPSEPTVSEHGVLMSMEPKLKAQMLEVGVPYEELDYFAISHLHFDHIGNLPDLLDTTILLNKEEWDDNRTEEAKARPGYSQEAMDQLASAPDLKLVEGTYDVFGDGSVRLIHAPGHTMGSQILLVELENYGNVIISGDTVHYREELEHGVVPNFNVSPELTKQTIKMIQQLMVDKEAEFWIQHDPIQHKSRKISPEFYN